MVSKKAFFNPCILSWILLIKLDFHVAKDLLRPYVRADLVSDVLDQVDQMRGALKPEIKL